MFFVCGRPGQVHKFAGEARSKIGRELDLIDENRFDVLLDRRLPDVSSGTRKRRRSTSRTTRSRCRKAADAFVALEKAQGPARRIKAFQYDIVCNGIELSSGAIRNHQPEIMRKAFEIAGYGDDVLEQKFGGMLRALQYGAPPHGGIAPGIDRIVMLLCGEENLREVTMFPMNQQAEDLLMGAPSEVTPKQLRELHIRRGAAGVGRPSRPGNGIGRPLGGRTASVTASA